MDEKKKSMKTSRSTNFMGQSSFEMLPLRFSALTSSQDGMYYAATFGQGIFQYSAFHSWEHCSEGLPEGIMINRLGWLGATLFAATDNGLYLLEDDIWHRTEIHCPCFQAAVWGDRFAMTSNGLWCEQNKSWQRLAYPKQTMFDLLITPQFLFLGCSDGVAFYDLLTAEWGHIPLNYAITSLASIQQFLIGSTVNGELVMGNKRGGFDRISFGDIHVYKCIPHQNKVYACTNKGVYRLSILGERLMLHSLGISFAVTDARVKGNTIFITTMHYGIWYIDLQKCPTDVGWSNL